MRYVRRPGLNGTSRSLLCTSLLRSPHPLSLFTEKWSGWGKLTYPDGLVYEGFFMDGQFDGEGGLIFPESGGAVYKATWERGVEVPGSGALFFEDGLIFNPIQGAGASNPNAPPMSPGAPDATRAWPYLGGFDRRLWLEHVEMKRANVAPKTTPAKVQAGEGDVDEAAEDARGVA
jgi:hypothetical protein